MTNTEIIAKIKTEIEKQKESMKGLEPHTDFRKGQITAYNQILGIISTIENAEETLKINEKMKSLEQDFSSRSAMSRETTHNFRLVSISTDEP